MKWKIGNIEIANQVVLAPMAGTTNSAFRSLIKEFGCGLLYTEMVSDKAIVYNNKKTINMLKMSVFERPISQQIFGSDKESFVTAAKYVEKTMKSDIIDINMGCPVPKIALKSQAGAALLKDIAKVEDIVKGVTEAVNCPVTVKIRSGWDKNSINAVEVAKVCEKAGAKAICVHPRTRSQGYSGFADWEIIKQVKNNVSIPVIGNGDIKTCYDAKRMLEETNCDAIMVGRAVVGNPWLIKQIIEYIKDGKEPDEVGNMEKLDICLKHFEYLLKIKPEKNALLEMKGQAPKYIKGMLGANETKKKIYASNTIKELKEILLNYRKEMK